MKNLRAVGAIERLHLQVDCWCKGHEICECCGGLKHLDVDVRPDNQERMAVFSDVQVSPPV